MDNGNETYAGKVDGFARWLSTSVAAAFFASLERCSCVNVDADGEEEEEEEEEAHDRPLMLTTLPSYSSSFSSSMAPGNHIGTVSNPPVITVENLPV